MEQLHDEMTKAIEKQVRKNAKLKKPLGLSDEIASPSEHDLDDYDKSAGFDRTSTSRRLARLDANPFSDDEAPVNYNPADLLDYKTKVSKADRDWVRTLQIHTLYLALGHVLANGSISAELREMLRLRYGCDKKVQDIMTLPRFRNKTRSAFDAQMSRAVAALKEEFKTWWEVVAPNENDFADETMLRLWREFSREYKHAQLANDLCDKAKKVGGKIK